MPIRKLDFIASINAGYLAGKTLGHPLFFLPPEGCDVNYYLCGFFDGRSELSMDERNSRFTEDQEWLIEKLFMEISRGPEEVWARILWSMWLAWAPKIAASTEKESPEIDWVSLSKILNLEDPPLPFSFKGYVPSYHAGLLAGSNPNHSLFFLPPTEYEGSYFFDGFYAARRYLLSSSGQLSRFTVEQERLILANQMEIFRMPDGRWVDEMKALWLRWNPKKGASDDESASEIERRFWAEITQQYGETPEMLRGESASKDIPPLPPGSFQAPTAKAQRRKEPDQGVGIGD